jgi:hypothetical protein
MVLVFATYITFQLCQGVAAQAFAAARSAAATGAAGATPFRRDDLNSQALLGGGGSSLASSRTAPALAAAGSSDSGTIHVMATSNGSPYLNYQTRIMYKTFTMARAKRDATPPRAQRRCEAHRCADETARSALRLACCVWAVCAALGGPACEAAAWRLRGAGVPRLGVTRCVDPRCRTPQVQATPEGKHMKYFTRCAPQPAPSARPPSHTPPACVDIH